MQLWISNIGADYTTAFRLNISLNLFSYYHADNQKEKTGNFRNAPAEIDILDLNSACIHVCWSRGRRKIRKY